MFMYVWNSTTKICEKSTVIYSLYEWLLMFSLRYHAEPGQEAAAAGECERTA